MSAPAPAPDSDTNSGYKIPYKFLFVAGHRVKYHTVLTFPPSSTIIQHPTLSPHDIDNSQRTRHQDGTSRQTTKGQAYLNTSPDCQSSFPFPRHGYYALPRSRARHDVNPPSSRSSQVNLNHLTIHLRVASQSSQSSYPTFVCAIFTSPRILHPSHLSAPAPLLLQLRDLCTVNQWFLHTPLPAPESNSCNWTGPAHTTWYTPSRYIRRPNPPPASPPSTDRSQSKPVLVNSPHHTPLPPPPPPRGRSPPCLCRSANPSFHSSTSIPTPLPARCVDVVCLSASSSALQLAPGPSTPPPPPDATLLAPWPSPHPPSTTTMCNLETYVAVFHLFPAPFPFCPLLATVMF
jgi:hypothetical protein